MKGFDKLHIKSAVKARTPMDLSMSHLTTLDFGQIVPLYFNELVPGDQFNINSQYFSRMAPLVKPTYGKFFFKTASFFVPFYQLADDAEAFVNGQTTFEGATTYLRYIKYTDLITFLSVNGTNASPGNDEEFVYTNSSGSLTYRKFTGAMKYFVKVLYSLGYSLPQNVDLQTSSSWYSAFNGKYVSAMPLLAFVKAYNDYMSQSQRYNNSQLTTFLKAVKHNMSVTGYNSGSRCVDSNGLKLIMDSLKLCYENDYFTSAWQYPNSPLGTVEDVSTVSVPSTQGEPTYHDTVRNSSSGVYLDGQQVENLGYINQRSLDFLRSFDDWVRRNNFSGSRIVQKVYSRFGIKTEDFRTNYAHCLGTSSTPIQVGDVTATASTDVTISGTTYNNVVGDYAGKGIVSDNVNLSFRSSDWGYLMIFGYYTVLPMMSYGFNRNVLHVSPLDFYTPEFDALTANAISYGEVFTNPISDNTTDTSLDNAVYGFTEKYNEYRYGRDVISGEFRNLHPNADMNVWHTGRILSNVRKAGTMVAQSSSMNTLANNNSEYNRIFSVVDGANDHFYMTAKFNIKAVRPMLSLNQVPNLGEGNTVVSKNGNEIS